MFIPVFAVAENALLIDGIVLLVISLSLVSLTLFSAIGDVRDCEEVKWGALDVIALSTSF